MEPDVHIFAMPKGGNSAEEYEDATGSSSEGRRFAIADGATQSSFADRWSQILALEYIMNPPADEPTPARWTNWLQPLQEAWSLGIPWEKLPWFAMEKAQAGACTTLLALEFIPNENGNGSKSARPAFWHRWLGIARHLRGSHAHAPRGAAAIGMDRRRNPLHRRDARAARVLRVRRRLVRQGRVRLTAPACTSPSRSPRFAWLG
jgi:hypothetical protein